MRGCLDIFAVLFKIKIKKDRQQTKQSNGTTSTLRYGEISKTYALHQIIFGYSARMFEPFGKYPY